MEPGYETLTLKSPDGTVSVQTGVECKLPAPAEEIARVLSLSARAVPMTAEASEKEAKISGRVLFFVLYTDREGNLKKCECGVECGCGVKDDRITPQSDLYLSVRAENAHFRTQGGTVYLTAVMTAEVRLSTPKTVQAISSLSGAVEKAEEVQYVVASEGMRSSATVGDSWEENLCLADVLCYDVGVEKNAVSAGVGSVAVEGTICVAMLVKASGGGISTAVHTFPFAVALEDNDCMPGFTADISVAVGTVHFDVLADPDKNTSKIDLSAELLLTGALYKEAEVTLLADAFSETDLLAITRENCRFERAPEVRTEVLRLSAKAPLSQAVAADAKVLAALPVGTYPAGTTAENGRITTESVLTCAVYYAEEGTVKALTCDLPFTAETTAETEALASAETDFYIERFSADFAGETELAVSATAKANFTLRYQGEISVLTNAEECGERKTRPGAIAITFPKAGDDLWTLSSSLGVKPEKVMECNPDLRFPLTGEERVLLYTKKVTDYTE